MRVIKFLMNIVWTYIFVMGAASLIKQLDLIGIAADVFFICAGVISQNASLIVGAMAGIVFFGLAGAMLWHLSGMPAQVAQWKYNREHKDG